MICTPDESCLVNGVCFIGDISISIKVSNFVGFFGFCRMIFPLDLTVFIEDIDEFLADIKFVTSLFCF